MSWVVRNKLKGILELHGFLPMGRCVRIQGDETFDLDSLPVSREVLEDSRQLKIAFREGYLETEIRNAKPVTPFESEAPSSRTLSLWQLDIQEQLNSQAHHLNDLGKAVRTLLDKVSQLPQTALQPPSLDAQALQKVLRRESRNQVNELARVIRSGEQADLSLNETEATNRARLIEKSMGQMDVKLDSSRSGNSVTKVSSKENNKDKIDLLSHLGGAD